MVTDRDEVVDALKGGVLRGREVRELSTEWGEVFGIDIAAAELREAWSEARTRLPETGRWPVAVTAWNGRVEDEIFLRWLYGEGDNSPAAICERASALTLEDALARPHLLNAVAASRPPVASGRSMPPRRDRQWQARPKRNLSTGRATAPGHDRRALAPSRRLIAPGVCPRRARWRDGSRCNGAPREPLPPWESNVKFAG